MKKIFSVLAVAVALCCSLVSCEYNNAVTQRLLVEADTMYVGNPEGEFMPLYFQLSDTLVRFDVRMQEGEVLDTILTDEWWNGEKMMFFPFDVDGVHHVTIGCYGIHMKDNAYLKVFNNKGRDENSEGFYTYAITNYLKGKTIYYETGMAYWTTFFKDNEPK